jgi:hypothetical protein
MFDLILLRGRAVEGLLFFSKFEAEMHGFDLLPIQFLHGDSTGNGTKMQIPPFESECLKNEKLKTKSDSREENSNFYKLGIMLGLGFLTFAIAAFWVLTI